MIELVRADRCTGCNLCVQVCPLDVFRLVRNAEGKKKAIIVYQPDCQSCMMCEVYCPEDALYVNPQRGLLHAVWPDEAAFPR